MDGIESRDDAQIWIIRHQFGRRNLDTLTRCELGLKLEPLWKTKAAANLKDAGRIGGGDRKSEEYRGLPTLAKVDPEPTTPPAALPTWAADTIQATTTAPAAPKPTTAAPVAVAPMPKPTINPVDTRAELAKAAGVSHGTLDKAKVVLRDGTEAQKERIRSGASSITKEYKAITKETKKQDREEKREAIIAALPPKTDRFQIIKAPVGDLPIDDESVDVIITDPPYPAEFLSVYPDLARTAARVLKPGGSCFVMIGQSYLPDIVSAMCEHLTYQWTIAYLTPGGQATQIFPRKVNTFWKPVLWFVKGEYKGEWMGDVAHSRPNDNDKRFHHWGQSESGMADLINKFSEPGQVILDPFLGGGTTGVVALDLGRRFIGSDIDDSAIATSLERLYKDMSDAA